jgi:hypothetical protein
MCVEGSTVAPPPGPARNRPLTGQHSCRQPAKVIVVKHGRWLGIEHISSRIQASRLVTEQAVERLLGRKMLFESLNYIHGSTYRLSPEGRDYAIEQGMVK